MFRERSDLFNSDDRIIMKFLIEEQRIIQVIDFLFCNKSKL
jgi:hypothetical protein